MEEMEIDDSVNKSLVNQGDVYRNNQRPKHVAVCLGFLCAVLLAGNVGQFIFYEIISPASFDVKQDNYDVLPQNTDEVLTADGKRVQSVYDALSVNKNHLKDRINNLTKEKEQLQKSYQSLTVKRDEMEASFKTVTNQKGQLKANYSTLKKENEHLKTRYNEVERSFQELQMNHKNLTTDINQLKTKHTNLQREKEELHLQSDQLKRNDSSLRREKDQLQQSLDSLNKSKNQIETNYRSLQDDKLQLQTRLNDVMKEKEQLQTKYGSLVTDREQWRKILNKMTEKVRGLLCPAHWTKFNTSCYFISTGQKNWTESRRACMDEGADLMVIDSHDEQVFVNGLMDADQNAWIGLTDSLQEGVWMWLDGTTVTETFWQAGQPNSYEGEQDCGELVHTQSGGAWNDDGCFAKQFWICEK